MPSKAKPRAYVLISSSDSARATPEPENEPAAKRRRVETDDDMSRSPVTPVKRPIQETVDSDESESRCKSITPSPSKAKGNVYAHARSLLRLSSDPTSECQQKLVGREAEREALDAFLSKRLPMLYEGMQTEDYGKAVLYVSGMPGTGKTAMLLEAVKALRNRAERHDIEINMVNCLSLKEPSDVWSQIVKGVKASRGKSVQETVEDQLRDSQQQRLLILDEADCLARGKRNVLRQLFALANDETCHLTLIAVANSLDITQLTAEDDEMPELLHFPPYAEKSLIAIATQRLALLQDSYDGSAGETVKAGETALFQPVGLQLLARKIQAHSGDLRSFLGLLRNAIGLVEEEQMKALPPTPTSTPTRTSRSGIVDPLAHFKPASAPKVTPRHALTACKNAKSGTSARLASIDPLAMAMGNINLGARLVLIALAIMSRDSSGAALDVSKAYAAYLACIKRAGGRAFVDSLNEHDFRLTVENLDVAGLLRASKPASSPVSKAKKVKVGGAAIELSYAFDKVLATATTSGKAGECALAMMMIDKNRVKKRYEWQGDEEAPSAGFNGNGLDTKARVMGNKRSHDEVDDM